MPYLTYNEETNEVDVSPEAKEFEEIKNIFQHDLTDGNRFFKRAMKYVYHMYYRSHPLQNLLPQEREKRVIRTYLNSESVTSIKNSKHVRRFIKSYLYDQFTTNERFYLSIKKDLEDLKEYIGNIPFTRKIHKKEIIDVMCRCPESKEEVPVKVEIDVVIPIDNSAEKITAVGKANTLIELEEKIRNNVLKEKMELKKQKIMTRLFDTREK